MVDKVARGDNSVQTRSRVIRFCIAEVGATLGCAMEANWYQFGIVRPGKRAFVVLALAEQCPRPSLPLHGSMPIMPRKLDYKVHRPRCPASIIRSREGTPFPLSSPTPLLQKVKLPLKSRNEAFGPSRSVLCELKGQAGAGFGGLCT